MILQRPGFQFLPRLGGIVEAGDEVMRVPPLALQVLTLADPLHSYGVTNTATVNMTTFTVFLTIVQPASTALIDTVMCNFGPGLWKIDLDLSGVSDYTPTFADVGFFDVTLHDLTSSSWIMKQWPQANVPFGRSKTIEIFTTVANSQIWLGGPATGVGETWVAHLSLMAQRLA